MTHPLPTFVILLLIVSSAATLGALACTWLLKKQSSALRHFIWSMALLAPMAALALFAFGPRWNAALLPPVKQVISPHPLISEMKSFPAPVQNKEEGGINLWLLVWSLGLFGVAGKIGLDHLKVYQFLRKQCSPAPEDLVRRARHLSAQFDLGQAPRIFVASSAQIPFCSGILRPVVVFPDISIPDDTSKLDFYLQHELAHIVRHDLLWLLLGHVACALCWFNPLIWVALAKLRSEAELAADDRVLAAGAAPALYATGILDLVKICRSVPESGLVLSIARPGGLSRRIQSILDGSIYRQAPSRGLLSGIAVGASLLLFAILSVRLVAADVPHAAPTPATPSASTNLDSVNQDLKIIRTLDKAEHLELQGDYPAALDDFKDGYAKLLSLYASDPNWLPTLMGKRINACRIKIGQLQDWIAAHPPQTSVTPPSPASTGLPERYLGIFLKINEAEGLERHNDYRGALDDFNDCYTKLASIHESDPDWESELIIHRINDCQTKISQLKEKLSAASP